MDFLRLISEDLHTLHHEVRKKYPVVKEAIDKALAMLPLLQKQYVNLLREQNASMGSSPGPGHPMFKCDILLRPFLLTCNHTNASHKILILALISIQRLVSWDAIEPCSIKSIVRVLQIQAEKSINVEVHVKLLQTLLQLVTVNYEEKPARNLILMDKTLNKDSKHIVADTQLDRTTSENGDRNSSNSLIGNEDLVMQAVWICLHLHETSSGPNSVVGNTAAMTIRQVVSMAFGKVHRNAQAKRCGIILFQELCLMSREENGVWLNRSNLPHGTSVPVSLASSSSLTSKDYSFSSLMSTSLAVELLETILSSHARLFRSDVEFRTILQQHIVSLIQLTLEVANSERGLAVTHGPSFPGSSSIGPTSSSTMNTILANSIGSTTSSSPPVFSSFPLLVRVMRLASIFLGSFSDVLPEEASMVIQLLLEIISNGSLETSIVRASNQAKLPEVHSLTSLINGNGGDVTPTLTTHVGTNTLLPGSTPSSNYNGNAAPGGSISSHATGSSFVTWSVLLALEVVNRFAMESTMIAAIASVNTPAQSSVIATLSKVVANMITSCPGSDFRPHQDHSSLLANYNGNAAPGGSISSHATGSSFVTWSVLLALEVVNRFAMESTMIAAIASVNTPAQSSVIATLSKVVANMITSCPGSDFRPHQDHSSLLALSSGGSTPTNSTLSFSTVSSRCGLELLNEQEAPPLQQSLTALRVSVTCQSNLISSLFDLSRIMEDEETSQTLAKHCVSNMAPYVLSALQSTMRNCREMDLIIMSLKSYHLLATTASRLGAILKGEGSIDLTICPLSPISDMAARKMEEIILACLRALCAFSFPLPDGIISSNAKNLTVNSTTASIHHPNSQNVEENVSVEASGQESDSNAKNLTVNSTTASIHHPNSQNVEENVSVEASGQESDSCNVLITWREIHAMKAVFGAAHIMEAQLSETEWFVLLQGLETIVGLTDSKARSGQYKILTKMYRIASFRVEDEDIEQQLMMLGASINEFFEDARKLECEALSRLLNALCRVCRYQLGFSVTRSSPNSFHSTKEDDLATLHHFHQLKVYQNYLGIGLQGSGHYVFSFSLRMFARLAPSNAKAFRKVTHELLEMTTSKPLSLSNAEAQSFAHFQAQGAEQIMQLLQVALLDLSESIDALSIPQAELFEPLYRLVTSDVKERTLSALLELLNTCGHLIADGWPFVLSTIQQAAASGDLKTQLIAFKCLRLIVDDLLVSLPHAFLPNCVECIGQFACNAKDVNVSLTAVNELWSVADIIGKDTNARSPNSVKSKHWSCAFQELGRVALDTRTEVRNCAINTLFGTGVTYGNRFSLTEWQVFLEQTVLSIAIGLQERRKRPVAPDIFPTKNCTRNPSRNTIVMHHSRDSAEKQWDESQVLMFAGISRVLQSNCHHLRQYGTWFAHIWRVLLRHVIDTATGYENSKEVVITAIQTLQTLLQVAVKEYTHSTQPVRASAGMRVVGGALVSASPSAKENRSTLTGNEKPLFDSVAPELWTEAFHQLIGLSDVRNEIEKTDAEEEQEIAGAMVSVLCTLYIQCRNSEFSAEERIERMLNVFEVLIKRYVLVKESSNRSMKGATQMVTSSLQSRILNAFEECNFFEDKHVIHCKMLDQLIQYILMAASRDLVYFTRHALVTLAKVYAHVTIETRASRFLKVLGCISPFLRYEGDGNGIPEFALTLHSSAQKAAANLWKNALEVLLVLISHGLEAIALETLCFQALLDTIAKFLQIPRTRTSVGDYAERDVLPFPRDEKEMGIALSALELLVEKVDMLARDSDTMGKGDDEHDTCISGLLQLLVTGADICWDSRQAWTESIQVRLLMTCCIRQLCTLGIQENDKRLGQITRAKLVAMATIALERLSCAQNEFDGRLKEGDASEDEEDQARVLVFLSAMSQVGVHPQCVLELFPLLCQCITSTNAQLRKNVQEIFLRANLPQHFYNAIGKECDVRLLMTCCIRQLCTLGIQENDKRLGQITRAKLVAMATIALERLSCAQNEFDGRLKEGDASEDEEDQARVLVFLSAMSQVGVHPQCVLELFPLLCQCITSTNAQLRKNVQEIFLRANLPQHFYNAIGKECDG
ncbi:hypothetical protein ABG067_005749 [Albugo candida]